LREAKGDVMPRYASVSALPQVIPVFPLSGALLLPRTDLPLNIFEPRYIAMVEHAMSSDHVIGMIQPLPGEADDNPALAQVGCLGRITSYAETDDNRLSHFPHRSLPLCGEAREEGEDPFSPG
jgi:Lon protease-like protein